MSELRDMIADSVNRMFSDTVDRNVLDQAESGAWPAALWKLVEESGFHRILAPESAGGASGTWDDAWPVLHAIGRHRVPLPLSETLVASALLARAGLPLPEGPLTVLQQRQGGGDELRFSLEGGKLLLTGAADAVPWARFARAIVVAGRAGETPVLGLVPTDAAGLNVEHGANIAREPRDRIEFRSSACAQFARCDGNLPQEPALLYGALARSAMIVGAAESVLEQSVQYANDRVQFGRAIGKFQAIQQSLAVLASEVTSAQSAALAAFASADGAASRFDIAVAKIRAGQAAGAVAAIAHQVHGAFGFTHEHTLHYATRRLWSWRAEFGAESAWARELGVRAIARGGRAFWADLTSRYERA